MAVTTELYQSLRLQIDVQAMRFDELTTATPQEVAPTMLVDAASLDLGQLAILTNAKVVPLVNGEIEGRGYMGQRPADLRIGGEYYNLTTDKAAESKAASRMPADRQAALEVELAEHDIALPKRLLKDNPTVAEVHRRSLRGLPLPGMTNDRYTPPQMVSELVRGLGPDAISMMKALDYNSLVNEAVAPDGAMSWAFELVPPGTFPDDPEHTNIFGFGRDPEVGVIPHPVGIVAMRMLADRLEGRSSTTIVADARMLRILSQQKPTMERLDDTLASVFSHLGDPAMSKLVIIDASGISQVTPNEPTTTSQYDLLIRSPQRARRRVVVPKQFHNVPINAVRA